MNIINSFSLVICTYNRKQNLNRLLESIVNQASKPKEIIIVDSSDFIHPRHQEFEKSNLIFYKWVTRKDRGLTKQRNIGIRMVHEQSNIICFLDDDVILNTNYFKELMITFNTYEKAIGVGGYIVNEIEWKKKITNSESTSINKYEFDGFYRNLPLRFRLRKRLGLSPNTPPGYMSNFGHGYSVSFLPPTEKTYSVEMLMGGVAAYRKSLFDKIQFSEFFQGYGLYEDADFSLRAAQLGKLYINTKAQLEHHHEPAGRPNMFKYGRMVVRNGHYVWRIKNPRPNITDRFKWHAITLLLLLVRATNALTGPKRKQALMETIGRKIGYFELLIHLILRRLYL